MVHVHAGRYRDVNTSAEYGLCTFSRQLLGNVEWAGMGAVIANPVGVHAYTERRHHLVEEPVVVIRREDDHEFGVVIFDECARLGDRALDVVKQVPRRPGKIQERAVGHTAQSQCHFGDHPLPG